MEMHKLTTLVCECCGKDAIFTEEGPNAEYAQILCQDCEAGDHKPECFKK